MNQHVLTNNRIRPLPDKQKDCTHFKHNPQRGDYGPGMHEYVCPECGKKVYFTVTR